MRGLHVLCVIVVESTFRGCDKTFKNYFKQENYLSVIKYYRYMTALVRFHISLHNLKIGTGYYTRPKTEICLRICTYCDSHEIDNFLGVIEVESTCPGCDKGGGLHVLAVIEVWVYMYWV